MDQREARFWQAILNDLKIMRRVGVPLAWSRIETHTRRGVPDLNLCLRGVETWVELKAPPLPARPSSLFPIGLSLLQADWIVERLEAGGRALALVDAREYGILAFWRKEKLAALVSERWTLKETLEARDLLARNPYQGISAISALEELPIK